MDLQAMYQEIVTRGLGDTSARAARTRSGRRSFIDHSPLPFWCSNEISALMEIAVIMRKHAVSGAEGPHIAFLGLMADRSVLSNPAYMANWTRPGLATNYSEPISMKEWLEENGYEVNSLFLDNFLEGGTNEAAC